MELQTDYKAAALVRIANYSNILVFIEFKHDISLNTLSKTMIRLMR